MAGRFAPSPTGDLHLGNLRTALVAWLVAEAREVPFLLRFEDLDRVASSADHEAGQQRDLSLVGIEWTGPVLRQSERLDVYGDALGQLTDAGLTYECYCTRREIRDAVAAPHDGEVVYPGTCRELSDVERARRRAERPPAIRFRGDGAVGFVDAVAGPYEGSVADVVLRRNDGMPAYNLAVVVDDAATGVDHVVRADDLLGSTPAQIALQVALGLPQPEYVHVPLVAGPDGRRLAKRDGAVTLSDLAGLGVSPARVRGALAASLGIDCGPEPTPQALRRAAGTLSMAAVAQRGTVRLAELGLPAGGPSDADHRV